MGGQKWRRARKASFPRHAAAAAAPPPPHPSCFDTREDVWARIGNPELWPSHVLTASDTSAGKK